MKNFIYKKRFGQNFLIDNNIVKKIVKTSNINSEDFVWEIGAGKGILTQELQKYCGKLFVFEIDYELQEYIEEKFKNYDNFFLIKSDIFKVNWQDYLFEDKKVKIVANIPYSISSKLLFKTIDYCSFFESISLMVQEELAKRITALPNNKDYGLLTLKIQYYYDTKILFKIPPHLFFPAPKVNSAIIMLIPKEKRTKIENENYFWEFVKKCFSSRRKMLRSNLKSFFSKNIYENLQKKHTLFFTKRAENISLEEFIDFYHLILKEIS